MSGWKARIGYLSPSVFETPSDWDLILPKGFTIVASGLNVQAHTESEFNKAIDALGAGLGIFAAEANGERGEALSLRMHRIRSGEQTITVTVPRRPFYAGIDPHHLLIDLESDDNIKNVTTTEGTSRP